MLLPLGLLLLHGCGILAQTRVRPEELQADRAARPQPLQARVDAVMQPMIASGRVPGAVVGVLLPDGSTHFFSYGSAGSPGGEPPGADTLFPVGSLSKGFLADEAALLVEERSLSWDEKLGTVFPQAALSADAREVTLLQLATHSAGMPRQPADFKTLEYFSEYLFDGRNFYRHYDQAYALDYLSGFHAHDAGRWTYSNIGYGVLSAALEQRSGRSVDALLDQYMVGPLRLRCTGYAPERLPCNARVTGHAGDQPLFIRRGESLPDWEFTPLMRGAAALYSTVRDLLAFAAVHLPQQRGYNPVLGHNLDLRFRGETQSEAVTWDIQEVGGETFTYQIGVVSGCSAYLGVDRRHGTAVVVLRNSFEWDASSGPHLLLRLAQDPPPAGGEAPAQLSR
jgi:CubicO group peptidase (beta-lactamase class C family)